MPKLLRDVTTGDTSTLNVDGVFVAIGHVPATDLFKGQLAMKPSGYLITDRLTESHPTLAAIRGLHNAETLVGLSRLPFAGWSIKIIARNSCALARTLASLRQILSQSLQFAAGLRT